MSLAEIKQRVAELSPEERLEVAALVAHLSHAEDPAYQTELSQRLDAMDLGKKFGRQDMQKMRGDLSAQGR